MNKRGQFIVIEGLDGSGKDTAIDRLKIDFPQIVYTREPGGTEVAEEIRKIFLGNKDRTEKLDTLTELFLMHAGRRQHILNLIRPNLENGISVVCNRFDPSTHTYQLFVNDKVEVYSDLLNQLHRATVGMFEPDKYIFLDVLPEESKRRTEVRASAGGEISRFDGKSVEYYQKIRTGYMDYLNKFCKNKHVIVDANKTKEEVYQALAIEIKSILAKVA